LNEQQVLRRLVLELALLVVAFQTNAVPQAGRMSWRWLLLTLSAVLAALVALGLAAAWRLTLLVGEPLQLADADLAPARHMPLAASDHRTPPTMALPHPLERQKVSPAALLIPEGRLPVASSQTQDVPRCAPGLRLHGSIVVAGHPEESIAALSTGRGTVLLHVGQDFEGARLDALRIDRAYVVRGGSACFLPLYLPLAERPRAQAPLAKGTSLSRASAFTQDELARGVRKIGTDRYAVASNFLRGGLAKAAATRRLGRFVPAFDDRRQIGMRVVGVSRGTLLSHLGIRSGDILRALNGVSLSKPDGLLEAFQLLPSSTRLSLTLQRSGQPRTLEYEVE
jgi:type II secretion system protein C